MPVVNGKIRYSIEVVSKLWDKLIKKLNRDIKNGKFKIKKRS